MTLKDIPGYTIRAFLKCLAGAASNPHPDLVRGIQKYRQNLTVSEISKEQIETLSRCTVAELWRHLTFIEREVIVSPCPAQEVQGDSP